MAVSIVTDSTADLPPELVSELGVTVVPLNVHFGEETLRDGVDIQPDEFYQRLTSSSIFPTTSQPAPGAFLEVYSRLTEQGGEVVSIHISSKLSRTLNSAEVAKAQLPVGATVELVDTLQASMGIGLVVMATARAALVGASLAQVVEVARRTAQEVQLFFLVDTLKYLEKGGRIGKAQALLGTLLSIKPILKVADGEVHPLERIRTRSKALERLYQLASECAPLVSAAVLHSTTPEEAARLKEHLKSLAGDEVVVGRIGPVVGTHAGPGTIGFAVQRR